MRSDDKFWLSFWISAFVAVLVGLFLIFSHIDGMKPYYEHQAQREFILKRDCAMHGGTWLKDSNDVYSCNGAKP